MPVTRPKVNGSLDRFRPGFKVRNFVTEYRKPKDGNGDRILHAGPTLGDTSAIEAKISVAKTNRSRPYGQRIRVING